MKVSFFAIAAFAAASFFSPASQAMAVGEVLKMPPNVQSAYLIGVMDGWAIEPRNLDCQDALSNRELLSAAMQYLNSISSETPDSVRGQMRKVPAALALHLELSRLCAAVLKKP